jgi:hypothetical protein
MVVLDSDGRRNKWPDGLKNDHEVIHQIHLQAVGFDISWTSDRCRLLMYYTPTLR